MHLTVGYLATPTGHDGVALARVLAATFDATADIVLVVHHELPDEYPGRAQYQQTLVKRGEEWVSQAAATLAANGAKVNGHVIAGESFAESLIAFAEQKSSDVIVVGGARDGMFGGHVIGSVAGALLHCSPIPVALAPRGYAEDRPRRSPRSPPRCPPIPATTTRCRSRSSWPVPRSCRSGWCLWCRPRTWRKRTVFRRSANCR